MQNDWMTRLTALHQRLMLCPADLPAHSELAALLEHLDQHEEALSHWHTVLAADPNHLKAREGIARCRARAGRSLQSHS